MKEVAEEVAADLRDNGEQLKDMAVAPVKEAYEKAYRSHRNSKPGKHGQGYKKCK